MLAGNNMCPMKNCIGIYQKLWMQSVKVKYGLVAIAGETNKMCLQHILCDPNYEKRSRVGPARIFINQVIDDTGSTG